MSPRAAAAAAVGRGRQLPKTPSGGSQTKLTQQLHEFKRNLPDIDSMMATTPFLESNCTLPVSDEVEMISPLPQLYAAKTFST